MQLTSQTENLIVNVINNWRLWETIYKSIFYSTYKSDYDYTLELNKVQVYYSIPFKTSYRTS